MVSNWWLLLGFESNTESACWRSPRFSFCCVGELGQCVGEMVWGIMVSRFSAWIVVLSFFLSIALPILISIPFRKSMRRTIVASPLASVSFLFWCDFISPTLFPWVDFSEPCYLNPWKVISGLGYAVLLTIIVLQVLKKLSWFDGNTNDSSQT